MVGLRVDESGGSSGVLVGHAASVQCLHLMPGLGTLTLISGAEDGTVRIWDPARSHRPVQSIEIGPDSVSSVVSLDDHCIFAAVGGNLVRLDRRRPDPVLVYSGDEDINAVASSDRDLVWCDDAGLLIMAEVAADSSLVMEMDPILAHDNICTSVVVCSESDQVYTGGMDCKIGVWDLDGAHLQYLETNAESPGGDRFVQPSMVHWLSCSDDGGLLAAALQSSEVIVTDTNTFSLVRLHAHTAMVTNVQFAAFRPHDVLLSASSDSTLVVWNLDPSSNAEREQIPGLTAAERTLFDTNLIQARLRLLYKPNDIASTEDGRVYVADTSPDIHLYRLL